MVADDAFASRTQLIAENLAALRERISLVVDPEAVDIVAVTKGQPVDVIAACVANGLTLIGENYADELVAKAADPRLLTVRWTFQGRLQTNKINRLRPFVQLWQTLDSPGRADALAARVPGAHVLVQLNLTGDPDRSGVAVSEVDALVEHARRIGLEVAGVMGVGPDPDEPDWTASDSAAAFALAVRCADRHGLGVRSLGMSSDLELALAAGATMVRIGTALVGAR